jgi:hypothetical protein
MEGKKHIVLEKKNISEQILRNCDIADSQFAGLHSICGLALRLRDLYKWEKGLDPWVEPESSDVLNWIGEKEDLWEDLAEDTFHEISVNGHKYDPFDLTGINEALEPEGLIYGAGYVHSMRPTFFLARLENKKQVDGVTIYFLGQELARDLLTLPALSQEDVILIRKESAKLFLWDHIFFTQNSGRDALKLALGDYGIEQWDSPELKENFGKISEHQMDTYVYHELGELKDRVFNRKIWREMVAAFPHTPIELFIRTVKDLLADTNEYGTLRHIVEKRNTASLGFYVAFFDGLKKELFPELMDAFKLFVKTRDWTIIESAILTGYASAKNFAEVIISVFQEGKLKDDMNWTKVEIEKRLLVPLGL